MPKDYEQIAIWANACAHQAQAGLPVSEIIEPSACFTARKRRRVTERLRAGESLSDSLMEFYPDLKFSDISLIGAAHRVGQLPRGFELISTQYFVRARVQSLALNAFVYPLGIVYIGIFLISLQAILYQEVSLNAEAIVFVIRVLIFSVALYALKKLLKLRPPLMCFMLRLLPPLRRLSKNLAHNRLAWVLREAATSGLPVSEAFQLACDSSGASKSVKRVKLLLKGISTGVSFRDLFAHFYRSFPKSVRLPIAVSSPYDIPNWANLLIRKFEEQVADDVLRIRGIAKPLALIALSPVLFWQIQHLWNVMGRELLERMQLILG